MLARRWMVAAGLGLLAGCGDNLSWSLLDDPLAPLPVTLAELGLYPSPTEPDTVADQVIAYQTAQPLWSNGSVKDRYLAVPSPIDVSDRDRWVFPVGTLLFKTFRFPATDGAGDRPVETRVLRLGDDGWEYASYRWRDDLSDGDLLALEQPTPVPVTIDDDAFDHEIPSRLDCRTCHETGGQVVLGFDELGLGADQLADLAAAGVISGALPEPLDLITGDSRSERDALTYLEGNCTHCHDGGDGPSSSFDLRHQVAVGAVRCRPTAGQTTPGLRVEPGHPERSVLFRAVAGDPDDPDLKPMPPLGVQHRDRDGVEVLRRWIESMDGDCE